VWQWSCKPSKGGHEYANDEDYHNVRHIRSSY
jgi:hypothetical protein